jgi:membrane protease YdiL (CAAX protease family)
MVAVAFRRRARSRELGAIHARNESVGQAARPTGSRCLPLPLATLSAFVLISAIVAGVAEESGFRGYMQGGIEQRHGPVVAILVTGDCSDS